MKGKKRTANSSKTACRPGKKPRSQDPTHWFEEFYADFGFSDYCTDSEPEIAHPRREWSNSSFTGSVKDIKRIRPKLSKPSRNRTITTAEIHSEPPLRRKTVIKKNDANRTGAGPAQPCIYYGPESIHGLESVEIKAMKNDQVPTILTSRKRPLTPSDIGFSEVKKTKKRKLKNSDCDRDSVEALKQSDKTSNRKTSAQTDGLRRSTRYRVPPLDFWRNQRLVFQTLASGEVQCMGIDEGTEADNFGLQQIARKAEQRKLRKKNAEKRKKSLKRVKTKVMNQQTGQLVPLQVHRPLESLQWSAPPNEVEPHAYNIAKTFTSDSTSFGFLDIFPFSEKKEQFSPILNLHFVAIKGQVEVTIQQKKFTFSVGDSWIVPAGVPYSIKNCSRARALVSFSTFKE